MLSSCLRRKRETEGTRRTRRATEGHGEEGKRPDRRDEDRAGKAVGWGASAATGRRESPTSDGYRPTGRLPQLRVVGGSIPLAHRGDGRGRPMRKACMDQTTPQGRRGWAPHRAARITLIVGYSIGLAAMAALLATRAGEIGWLHLRASCMASLVRRPPHEPATRPLVHAAGPPARKAVRHTYRVIAWSIAPTPRNRARRSARVNVKERRARTAPGRVRWPQRSRPAPRRPQLRMVIAPRRTPLVAWVNPPDPSWPKECRPPAPTVFVERY